MSASVSSQPLASEPFGQRGVRQYLFPALTCSSLVLMVLSIGMWTRSRHVADRVVHDGSDRVWYISSIYGRVLVAWGETAPRRGWGSGWTYSQDPINDPINDAWKPSIFKSMGLEWRFTPIDQRWGNSGGWLRIRWPLIIALSGVLPLVRVVQERRRRRAEIRMSNFETRNKFE